MKILFLDQFSDLGGAQLNLLQLLPGLKEEGWEPHVAVPPEGPFTERLAMQGAIVHPLHIGVYSLGRKTLLDGARYLANLPSLIRRVRTLARVVQPQILYVNGPRLMPAVAGANTGIPVVFHSHNRVTAGNGKLLVERAIVQSGAAVIAASQFLAREWKSAYVVYGAVDGPQQQPAPRANGPPRIGLIGRVAPQKGQLQFARAAALLSPKMPQAQFVLCGDVAFGDRHADRYKQRVIAAAPPSLQFLGWCDDVYQVLAGLDLLVVPSADEGGFPRVALEAFAAGVPVLAHSSGAVPEVILEGRNGYLLSAGTPNEIALRIGELTRRRQDMHQVACEAGRLWYERFTMKHHRRAVCDVLRNVYGPASALTIGQGG